MNNTEKEDSLTLELLAAIDDQSDLTQRHLADRLGVALGLANSYLKRCVRKGLIKIQQAPPNRYFYYLTPKGFAEKSRLTARYLSSSFDFYRKAGLSCTEVFRQCRENGWEKVLLCGQSELAEIASLRADEENIVVVGVLDLKADQNKFIGLPVWTSMDLLPDFDACVLTALTAQEPLLDYLHRHMEQDRILVPAILGISIKN